MKITSRETTLGFILTEEETARVRLVADYMGVTPKDLLSNSIERLFSAYIDALGGE